MQIPRLLPGNMSYSVDKIHIRDLSVLKDLDHKVGIDYLSDVWKIFIRKVHDRYGQETGRSMFPT